MVNIHVRFIACTPGAHILQTDSGH